MAVFRHLASERRVLLEAEFVVGRSPRAALTIAESYVSAQHAAIRWTGNQWEVRDLGSRNGTFVAGKRLETGGQQTISAGASVAFGHPTQEWLLEDDAAPDVMAISVASGRQLRAEGGLLVVPSADEPLALLYRAADGQWHLERNDEPLLALADQMTFEAGDETWRFCCPNVVLPTALAGELPEVQTLALRFAVSRDEEHVELRVESPNASRNLGARTHHYLLLTLARLRLADIAAGVPDTACGWVYQDELVQRLHTTPGQLNVEVFRIRQQFAALKFRDAAMIIERRPRSRQLRIGVENLRVDLL